MDSAFATAFLRRLLAHNHGRLGQRGGIAVARSFMSSARNCQREIAWQPKTDILPEDKNAEFKRYPMTTAEELRSKTRRPKRTKMLMRDFIEDSLYNPHYGYFSEHAVIFDPGEPFLFNRMRDENEFTRTLAQRYTLFEDHLDEKEFNDARQLWHTPTEIFRPHYAEAVAQYLLTNYKISSYPYHDLNIYELGAGNGTFMLNVLDYIRDADPEVYDRTRYQVIEISSSLAALQTKRVQAVPSARGHEDKVHIINRSIFDWDTFISSPCFVLALEVFDNFPHDVIRYDHETEQPLQGVVLIDTDGDFYEFYTPELDPVAARYIRIRDAACNTPHWRTRKLARTLQKFRASLPFAPNLSEPEYIPTRLMEFFDILNQYFPNHRLVTSDFHALPNSVKGINAPVVQTRYQRRTIPVTTPLVQQGYFDIFFPTDFYVMEAVYRTMTSKLTQVLAHEEFMRRWASVEDTQTRSGENPLLSWYKNASVMTTV